MIDFVFEISRANSFPTFHPPQNHANMAPVLMQWRGEGPSVPVAASRERQLRTSGMNDSTLAQFKRRMLGGTRSEEISLRRRLQLEESEFTHTVTFQGCVFRGNRVGDNMGFPGIIENSFGSKVNIEECIFQDNHFSKRENPAPFSYAVRSYGPIHLESSCFMDNTFEHHGPVQVFGAPHTTSGNYVQSGRGLTCDFLAVFASRDDTADAVPVCFDSEADSCPVPSSPTMAPTNGPPTTTTPDAPTAGASPGSQPAAPLKKISSSASHSISSVMLSLTIGAGVLCMALA